MIGQTVSHYRVLDRIGAGGMGVVYEAEDLELGRRVALKFLPPALAADPQAVERFRREARAASALNHRHICTIYEISTHAGQPFIVMEHLEGQTLRQMEGRSLQPEKLLAVAIQIADALDAAHSAGFVHRDIKPANVFLTTRDEVKLLDFGLAKLVREGGRTRDVGLGDMPTVTDGRVTQKGVVVGTVAYMSPEQIRGEELDGRSDLFSFGALLYVLATGREPFAGGTDALVSDAILHQDPRPPSATKPDLHPDLERIIGRALEKDRNLRYQTAADMRADLERLRRDSSGSRALEGVSAGATRRAGKRTALTRGAAILVGLAALLAAVAAVVVYRFVARSPVLAERDAILVADFDNTTGETVFDDTLRQALIVQLQQSPYFTLVSRERVAATLRLMGRPATERLTRTIAREVCQREGAKAMLVGSIAPLGANYVVTLEGVNCVTGDVLGTVQNEAHGKENVLQAVATGAGGLRARLGETLASVQDYDVPMRQAATASLEALKLFSAAMAERDGGRDADAVPLLQRAVQIDPEFALAWSHLAATLQIAGRRDEATEAITRAFAMRDRVPEQERYYISHRYYAMTGEIDKAIESNRAWAKVDPRNWRPHQGLCSLLWQVGETNPALAECREALRLGPESVYVWAGPIEFSMVLGQFGEARTLAERMLASGVSNRYAHGYLARLAWLEADHLALDREIAWLRTNAAPDAEALQHEMAVSAGRLAEAEKRGPVSANVLASVGELDEARERAEPAVRAWLNRPSPTQPVNAFWAMALAGEGRVVEEFAEQAARVRPNDVIVANVFLPALRASVELSRGNGAKAVELLRPTRRYGFGVRGFDTTYLRGLAFLQAGQAQDAATEFERIIGHRGVAPGSVYWALAHLGVARARVLSGDKAAARQAYEQFLALWSDADADLPVLREAKREHENLALASSPR